MFTTCDGEFLRCTTEGRRENEPRWVPNLIGNEQQNRHKQISSIVAQMVYRSTDCHQKSYESLQQCENENLKLPALHTYTMRSKNMYDLMSFSFLQDAESKNREATRLRDTKITEAAGRSRRKGPARAPGGERRGARAAVATRGCNRGWRGRRLLAAPPLPFRGCSPRGVLSRLRARGSPQRCGDVARCRPQAPPGAS